MDQAIEVNAQPVPACDCALTEGEFLEATLRRIRQAKATPQHLDAAALEACDNERVGEEFSRTPFLF